MSTAKPSLSDKPANPPALVWTGRVISALPVLGLFASAFFKFVPPPGMEENLKDLGWPMKYMLVLGITEVLCAIIYAVPQTSVLGAILVTGYLGGAIATHARIGEQFIPPLALGVLVWLGLFLRDARLRALLPLRQLT